MHTEKSHDNNDLTLVVILMQTLMKHVSEKEVVKQAFGKLNTTFPKLVL